MAKEPKAARDPREGGWIWNLYYKYWAGPATVDGAIQGFSEEAHDGWKRDLANRKRYSREQRERRRAAREAEKGTDIG
jgi:hypothetical protein